MTMSRSRISGLRTFTSSTIEEKLSKYGFWKERYKKLKGTSSFDWFLDSTHLLENISSHLEDLYKHASHPTIRYLELGCGNSQLPLAIYKESPNPVSVFAMDYVMYAAQQQKSLTIDSFPKNNASQFQAICGDVMRLPFKPQVFDLSVDKGTMDALIKNKTEGYKNSCVMFSEVLRTLTPGGRYIQISDEDPDSRFDLLDKLIQWNKQFQSNHNVASTADNSLFQGSNDNIIVQNVMERNAVSVRVKGTERNNPYQKSIHRVQTVCNDVKTNVHDDVKESESKSLDIANESFKNELMSCSPWKFKVVMDEVLNKEYFMYWTEKVKSFDTDNNSKI